MPDHFRDVLSLSLRCDEHAPSRARDALEGVAGIERVREQLRLVVSELVSNAVRHSGCGASDRIGLTVRLSAREVEVAVCDEGRAGLVPGLRHAEPDTIGGLGLPIVAHLAECWGTTGGPRRTVWAQLGRAPEQPA